MSEIRVIVCGGRNYTNRAHIRTVLLGLGYLVTDPSDITIVHGACPFGGADIIAGEEAQTLGYGVEEFPPDKGIPVPNRYHARNKAMARAGADRCIAFPGGNGTAAMIEQARAHGIPVQDERHA